MTDDPNPPVFPRAIEIKCGNCGVPRQVEIIPPQIGQKVHGRLFECICGRPTKVLATVDGRLLIEEDVQPNGDESTVKWLQ